MPNIVVKLEFEQKLYDELKQALTYFSIPVVDPQSLRFAQFG